MPRQMIAAIGLLVLTSGCLSRYGRGATDLPHTRPLPVKSPLGDVLIPVDHPPDGLVVAREPQPRWVTQLNGTLARHAPDPIVNWSLLGLLILF